MRHGLTAETIIQFLEHGEDYKSFELAVTADFEARTTVERPLILRLASLFWRLNRATAIETGLLQMQSHVEQAGQNDADQLRQPLANSVLGTDADKTPKSMQQMIDAEIASRFLALNSEKNNGAFERLNRYETRTLAPSGSTSRDPPVLTTISTFMTQLLKENLK